MGQIALAVRRFRALRSRLQAKLSGRTMRRAKALLLIQAMLLLLILAILLLILAVNQAERRADYAALVLSLAAVLTVALHFNLTARYRASAWITMIGIALAPWSCLLIDPRILQGDVIPLVYVVLSIHLSATFLNEWATAAISLAHLVPVTLLLTTNPHYANLNWPSFCAYILCASALSIATSFIARKQVEQIEEQNRALKESEEKLLVLSTRDPLTGLFNRRYMEDTLEREIARVLRKGLPLGLVMADINNFKAINDTYGHLAGDSVLHRIAQILTDSTRKSDVVCRLGGDEFILVFPECTPEMVASRRDRIAGELARREFEHAGIPLGPVTMSFGAAFLPDNGRTPGQLLAAADAALYASKRLKPPCPPPSSSGSPRPSGPSRPMAP